MQHYHEERRIAICVFDDVMEHASEVGMGVLTVPKKQKSSSAIKCIFHPLRVMSHIYSFILSIFLFFNRVAGVTDKDVRAPPRRLKHSTIG